MRRLIVFILSISFYAAYAQTTYPELKLISISQLKTADSTRFDLSGIVSKDGNYYVIADKQWNNYIYQINFTDDYWYIVNSFEFNIEGEIDIEAIDVYNDFFLLENEKNGKIYKKQGANKIVEMAIDFEQIGEDPGSWGNAGWEGMAVDQENGILYIIKERQPRFIFKANIETGEILDKFNIPETESKDFADAKFENGYLYLLERNGNYVTKVIPNTHKVIDKVTYKLICSMPEDQTLWPGNIWYGRGSSSTRQ